MIKMLIAAAIILSVYLTPTLAQDTEGQVEQLVPEVVSTLPHDPTSFTQGLLLHDGVFYESTGIYGMSNLRLVDPPTGDVLIQVNLPAYIFAEGLALVDNRLIQITWRSGVALVYDREAVMTNSLQNAEFFTYQGDGWGLCYDGRQLYMSDGSSTLFVRDPATFEVVNQITVTLDGEPLTQLNELECVGDSVYANVWQTNQIVRIDKASGNVTGNINATGLLTAEETAALGQEQRGTVINNLVYDSTNRVFVNLQETLGGGGTLNGIAYKAESDTFFITGKLWPKIFEVRFVPPAT